jgi:hypothetical protein
MHFAGESYLLGSIEKRKKEIWQWLHAVALSMFTQYRCGCCWTQNLGGTLGGKVCNAALPALSWIRPDKRMVCRMPPGAKLVF